MRAGAREGNQPSSRPLPHDSCDRSSCNAGLKRPRSHRLISHRGPHCANFHVRFGPLGHQDDDGGEGGAIYNTGVIFVRESAVFANNVAEVSIPTDTARLVSPVAIPDLSFRTARSRRLTPGQGSADARDPRGVGLPSHARCYGVATMVHVSIVNASGTHVDEVPTRLV